MNIIAMHMHLFFPDNARRLTESDRKCSPGERGQYWLIKVLSKTVELLEKLVQQHQCKPLAT